MCQLRVHRADITSTRCEIYALLAGNTLYGDAGEQICDNKSAIHILRKARAYANGALTTIKFRDPHRMEIKSISKAMNESGSFEALWVRSHKEHEVTNGDLLRQRRQSLACVDNAAKNSLQQELSASYSSWLQFDSFLRDNEGRPVIGNTLSYLYERVNAVVRSSWIAKQSHKPPSRRMVAFNGL
ncbi:hypothetical protein DVH05_001420 [Phytophthora capsici]|nr:hypothetical protein DVH05_001420 [Phytophthora capsici]